MLNRCYLCKVKEELANHLLLHCPKASILLSNALYYKRKFAELA